MSCIVRIYLNLIYNSISCIQDSDRFAVMMKRLWVVRSYHMQVSWPNSRFVSEFKYTNAADGRYASINLNPLTNKLWNYIQINLRMRLFFHTIHMQTQSPVTTPLGADYYLPLHIWLTFKAMTQNNLGVYYLTNVQVTY